VPGFCCQASGFRLQASGFRREASGFWLLASGVRLQASLESSGLRNGDLRFRVRFCGNWVSELVARGVWLGVWVSN